MLLMGRGMTLSVAESCTGGMLGATITDVHGSSSWFAGGVISYADRIKINLLGVPESVILAFGAVSRESVEAMVKGVATIMSTDCAIAVSGIAGPSGGSTGKPVGLVHMAVSARGAVKCFDTVFAGDRAAIREQATAAALEGLITLLTA